MSPDSCGNQREKTGGLAEVTQPTNRLHARIEESLLLIQHALDQHQKHISKLNHMLETSDERACQVQLQTRDHIVELQNFVEALDKKV